MLLFRPGGHHVVFSAVTVIGAPGGCWVAYGGILNHGHDVFVRSVRGQLDGAAEAEVGDAHVKIGGRRRVGVDEDVGGLEIAMHHAAAVQVRHGGANLAGNVTDLVNAERIPLQREKLFQVNTAIFEHDVQVSLFIVEKCVCDLQSTMRKGALQHRDATFDMSTTP